MKPFPQPLWFISIGHLIGLACIALGLFAVANDLASPFWLLLWPVTHVFDSLMLSVGLHRYFAHRSFQTSPLWHRVMAYWSVLLMNGSPMGWALAHMAHHYHSDTDLDPHLAVPSYLLWKRYRNVPYDRQTRRNLRHLLRDRHATWAHNYGTVLWLLFAALLAAIDWRLFVFGYGMALGSVHLIGGLHQVLSHKDGAPRNLPWLEFVLPAMGEWMHATHHKHWRRTDMRTRWWHIDLGYLFIRLIESRSS